jgi:hypothetical protein
VGDVVHRVVADGEHPLLEAEHALTEIEIVGEETGGLPPEIAERVQRLRKRLEQSKLSEEAQKLLRHQQAGEGEEVPDER